MKRTRSKKQGSSRMVELGYKPLQLWLSPTMHELLTAAARKREITISRFCHDTISRRLAFGEGNEKGSDSAPLPKPTKNQ